MHPVSLCRLLHKEDAAMFRSDRDRLFSRFVPGRVPLFAMARGPARSVLSQLNAPIDFHLCDLDSRTVLQGDIDHKSNVAVLLELFTHLRRWYS